LQNRCSDAAAGAGNERALAGVYLRHAMDHLPSADVVQNDGGGLHVGNLVGDGHEMLRAADQEFGKSAMHGQRGDALSDMKAAHAIADCLDDAGNLVTADNRQFGRESVASR